MARDALHVFFSDVPTNHPAGVPVVRVDHALVAGILVSLLVSLGVSWLLWHPLPGLPLVPPGGWLWQWLHYPALMLWQVHHRTLDVWVDNPASQVLMTPWPLHARLFPGLALGLLGGAWVFCAGLAPQTRMRHVEGPRFLEGPEAQAELVRVAASECAGEEPFLELLPGVWLPKKRLTRGVLLYGSPGSGKTQAMIPMIQQFIDAGHRCWVYDVKGDFSSYWLGGSVGLICPQDRRSLVWDIAQDVRVPGDAQTFANSLIPDAGGDGKFWSEASRSLLEGTLISLQNELGTNWGWSTLAERLTVDSVAMAERMAKHAPLAVLLVQDSTSSTTSSVLATLSAYTKLIHDLARAFGDGRREDNGLPRPSISLRQWASDGYTGKISQIIFQAGQDAAMTEALGTAMLNLVLPVILSAATPDDELGRTIGFFVDEMASLPVPFLPAIERGRSKGLVWVSAVQTLDQIEQKWDRETMRSLGSMIGTQLCFRVQPSPGRDALSDQFGKARWAITSGDGSTVHEESRAVVPGHTLSALGSIKDKRLPLGWGVECVLAGLGPDLLRITFPGVKPPKRRTPHRPARWTTEPAQVGVTPELTKIEREAQKLAQDAQKKAEAVRLKHEQDVRAAKAQSEQAMRREGAKRKRVEQERVEARHEPEPGPDHNPEASPFPPKAMDAAEQLLAAGKHSPLARLTP